MGVSKSKNCYFCMPVTSDTTRVHTSRGVRAYESSDTTRVSYDMMASMSTRMHDVTSRGSVPDAGVKHDAEKPDYSLLPFHALEEAVKTLTYGARKYSRDNWKRVPDFHRRYLSAAFRHVTAHARGELLDPETGLHHLSHAIVSLMYLVEDSLTSAKEECDGSGSD